MAGIAMRFQGLFLAGAVALAPGPAGADVPREPPPSSKPASCTLTVVNALTPEGGIDPALARLRPYLESPAFKAWKTFKRLSEKDESLREGQTVKYTVPNGAINVTYTGHKLREDNKHALQATIQIDTPKIKTKTSFTVGEGRPFLSAGEPYNDGILIYALTCKTAD